MKNGEVCKVNNAVNPALIGNVLPQLATVCGSEPLIGRNEDKHSLLAKQLNPASIEVTVKI
jgi:hypothetical protein